MNKCFIRLILFNRRFIRLILLVDSTLAAHLV